jgi:GNAT superfamily N-acetyltransferase
MNGLHIRDAHPGDRDAIEAVTLSAYQEYAAVMPAHWERYRQNILATLAAVEPAAQIVAEQDTRIVGAVLLYPPGTVIANPGDAVTLTWPEVRLLAVEPAVRGRGVGAALMNECVRRARHSGATVLTLHTTDVMQAAMRLYEHMGFRRAPDLDFSPAPGAKLKGYHLKLETTVPS